MSDATNQPEDTTEALLDKMSKDSFPASDPPAFESSSPSAEEIEARRDARERRAATLDLGEEVAGQGPQETLVLAGHDAAVLRIVADGRRLQVALVDNPLELSRADVEVLAAALRRACGALRPDA